MPTIADLKKSKYLQKSDVTPPVLVTISGYRQENVAKEGEPAEDKWLLTFSELDKPMVMNSINGELIAQALGDEDFDGWISKKIVLYVDPNVQMAGKIVGGIRCRAPKKPAVTAPAAAPAAAVAKPAAAAKPAVVHEAAEPESDDVPF